jgi:hypothetical protein
MGNHRGPVDHVRDAAREVSGWLDLLGRNCCAGRSYRGMDDAKARADCEDAAADAEAGESAGGSVPVHRAPSR